MKRLLLVLPFAWIGAAGAQEALVTHRACLTTQISRHILARSLKTLGGRFNVDAFPFLST